MDRFQDIEENAMFTRKSALTACGAALLALIMAASGDVAWVGVSRTNHLTFSGPLGPPGVTLPRGTYTFELIALYPDIVPLLSRDRSQVYFTGFTRQVDRPAGLRDARMVTYPAHCCAEDRGVVPIGIPTGHEFVYPNATR
jgi:hypothetical protein